MLEELGIVIDERRSDDTEIVASCPQHERRQGKPDRRPSWSVNRKNGMHNCFSCGYSGSLLLLVLDQLGSDDVWAADDFIREWGYDLSFLQELNSTRREPKRPEVNEEMLDLYELPPAVELDRRHITTEAAEHFSVLWDPREKAWVIPVYSLDGEFHGVQFKYTDGRPPLNYPEGMERNTTLFGATKFEGDTARVMESPLDVPRIWSAGFDGGLASFGAMVSDEQMRLALALADKLILAFDNDAAGRSTTRQLITGQKITYDKNNRPRVREVINWSLRTHTRVLYYGHTKAKDPGEMSDHDVEIAFERAIHSVRVR